MRTVIALAALFSWRGFLVPRPLASRPVKKSSSTTRTFSTEGSEPTGSRAGRLPTPDRLDVYTPEIPYGEVVRDYGQPIGIWLTSVQRFRATF